jgi:hypothetical protein
MSDTPSRSTAPNASGTDEKAMKVYAEAYPIVAARRSQWDQLLWQVPVLTLTAQAFLFSIALAHDTTRTARFIACLLSLVMTVLSLHLMVKHRQAEVADSQWLETYEHQLLPISTNGASWPMHGQQWARYRLETDPGIGWLRALGRFRGFQVWFWGLAIFGFAALAVLGLTIIRPELLGASPSR